MNFVLSLPIGAVSILFHFTYIQIHTFSQILAFSWDLLDLSPRSTLKEWLPYVRSRQYMFKNYWAP